jgi:hypothetical protein
MNQEPTKQEIEALEAKAEKISEETGKDFFLVLQELYNQQFVYGNQKEQQ